MKLTKLYESILNEVLYHGSKRDKLDWDGRDPNVDYNMLGYGIYLTDDKREAVHYAKAKDKGNGHVYTFKPIGANILGWGSEVPSNIIANIQQDPDFYSEFKVDLSEIKLEDYQFTVGDIIFEWDVIEEPLQQWAIDDNIPPGIVIYMFKNNEELGVEYGLTSDQIIPYIKSKAPLNNKIEIEDGFLYGLDALDFLNRSDITKSIAHLYMYLYIKFGSTKVASQYMVKMGVDGIQYNIDTSDYEGRDDTVPTVTVIYNMNKFKMIGKEIV